MAAIRLLRSAANLRLSVLHCQKHRSKANFGYVQISAKLNLSQFLIPEFGLGKFGTVLMWHTRQGGEQDSSLELTL